MRFTAFSAAAAALFLLAAIGTGPALAAPAPAHPTVQLYATREGLVGNTTASGHVVTPDDHFVALPSHDALGKSVTVSYNGRSETVPVLDVGPWNRNDAFWLSGSARGQFSSLPQWVPETWAAWHDGYNGGRDGVGRYVTFPAMIDLSDGVYKDLGMTRSDWVQVAFPWLAGASPPPLAPAAMAIEKKADPGVIHDQRYFAQTGYRVDSPAMWSYVQARGGTATFGYPVSRPFQLMGCSTQLFQRLVVQECAPGHVTLLNLLDPDIFPYTHINGSVLPASDASLKQMAPSPLAPDYGTAIISFIHDVVPDTWQGVPVHFNQAYFQADGGGNPLIALEVWGAPISRPSRDPGNGGFIYQRFQRGVMHYDAATGRTQPLLLADQLKALLTGVNLPSDLRAEAQGSRFYQQYCPGQPGWICRPSALPNTDLAEAFQPG